MIVEQETPCNTKLEDGTCYIVNERFLSGLREGEEAVMAWKARHAPWPELEENDLEFINSVLAAVKIVQDETEVISEIAESSCYCDDQDRAVYPMTVTSNANLLKSSPATEAELNDRLCVLRTLVHAFHAERAKDPDRIDTLVEALRLERIESDHYHSAWYLSLFEATKAMLSGHAEQQFNQRHRAYRKKIGHPKPDTKMNMAEFQRLQRDAMNQLRAVFLQK